METEWKECVIRSKTKIKFPDFYHLRILVNLLADKDKSLPKGFRTSQYSIRKKSIFKDMAFFKMHASLKVDL